MKHTYRIRLSDTDAAGRIYFASACRIAHESFEQFMESIGYGLNIVINKSEFALPVVHVEADYRKSLGLGESIVIDTRVAKIGTKSAVFRHVLSTEKGEAAIVITITHAAVSKKSERAIAIPPSFRKALTRASA